MNERSAKNSQDRPTPPTPVRWAGVLGMIQGVMGLVFAIVLVVREASGFRDPGAVISGYGTAAWFIFFFGAILIAGFFLLTGRKWGRGPVVMLQLCLLGVAYYMFTSDRPELGAPTALMAIAGLVLLFNPRAVDWAASRYNS
ncbi:hypothetical protein CUROG_07945 [Corynebacterium urogenitale]|uniref:Integral membrane protein n=1 Tax=Corynebacterium urogenitale TaxID=2487892 RepID=A0A5J6ZBL3_9CORY|nr:hypothetical protein [Corynebacterium urogenitale]QFQ02937.1 hypothetical protein CUROG_07945 [Corynebacterium urogenitale]